MRKATMTEEDAKWLEMAITMASEWRGEFVGNPDNSYIIRFDAQIERMRFALKRANKTRFVLSKLERDKP